jgi:3-deoxy-D-manno-octulosonate 8-phosphate phosphatase (KDO 8-P phosphatase)
VLDGHGLKLLREDGIVLAIISGRRARCVERRGAELGIVHIIQGAGEKLAEFRTLLDRLQLVPAQAAYMGDDVVDLPVLESCGFAISVPDAPASVKRAAQYVTRRRGGDGAVREACELLIRLRGQQRNWGKR